MVSGFTGHSEQFCMLTKTIQFAKRLTGSLRFKLSFYVGLAMFLTTLAFTYHSISTQEKHLVEASIQGALRTSEVIKAAIWNGMMTNDREVIRQIVHAIGREEGFQEINIYDRAGVLHYTSRENSAPPLQSAHAEDRTASLRGDMARDRSIRYKFTEDDRILSVVNPLVNTKSCSTAACHAHPDSDEVLGFLELKMPMQELRAQLADSATKIVIFAFFLFVMVGTMSGLGVIFFVSRPIRLLRKKAERIARGQYVSEPPMQGTTSIAILSRSLDEMVQQIAQRERQIDQSRRMFKDLFEKVPCYLVVVSPDYRIVRANQTFLAEFGDQVGKHCYKGFKGRDAKCPKCKVEQTFADGFPHRAEEEWNLDDKGTKAYVIVNTSPIFDEQGKVSEVLEMAVDVTRVEKLQTELRRKEQQFKNLFDNVPCYLTVIDRSFRIAFYNNMFAQDFGHSWGEHCYQAYKGKDCKCDNCPVEKTFTDAESHFSEEIWQHDGKDMHILVRTQPITNGNGEVVAVMEMCTNVTELKLLENELAILGETIAGTSHAVKNILSGLEGGVYVVDSGLKSGKQDRVRTGWGMVKKNVEKVSELVKDILYASKERKPEYQECRPETVLLEVYELYQRRAGSHGIDLIKDFDTDLGQAILDPHGIHNVLSNLIANAMGACSSSPNKDGHRIVLSARRNGDRLILQVSDDGVGMSEEVKENLFKKFFSTKGSKGTGLGLLVTRKIIEEHGGTITFTSEPGKGTTFVVELPVRPVEPTLATHVADDGSEASPSSQGTVTDVSEYQN
jgi:histidine kinase